MSGDGHAGGMETAARHALGWLLFGNLAGLWLSVLLLWPDLGAGEWTYGRWVPVHLNVQLYGWTSLPLVAWLMAIYQVDASRVRRWGAAADVLRARSDVDQAVAGLRRSGNMDDLPLGLLTRAWLRCLLDARSGSDSAQADLDEAWAIAERGPMRLFLADIHLHRARLFHAATPYPWDSPRADLAAARELIEQCGYGRRLEELADAEAALGCART